MKSSGTKRWFAAILVLMMVLTLLPVTAFATEEGGNQEVITCTKSGDCAATTHDSDCPKYVAPCTKDENCTATTHETDCPKYVATCTKNDDCAATTHEEGCPKYEKPEVACTKTADCPAEEHAADCLKYLADQKAVFVADMQTKIDNLAATELASDADLAALTAKREELNALNDEITAFVNKDELNTETLTSFGENLDKALLASLQTHISELPSEDKLRAMSYTELCKVMEELNLISDALDAMGINVKDESSDKFGDTDRLFTVQGLINTLIAEAAEDAKNVYVSTDGSDDTGNGTKDKPFESLAKAVDCAVDGATIILKSDITSTECARYYDKHLTIKSEDGQVYTVTRGATFARQPDNARGWYNPALIEVDGSTPGTVTASLRLENIVLDDAGNKMGTHYVQAESAEFGHTDVVQDAMIATYNNVATITLGYGTTLKNFGGMSAVRVSGGTLYMETGSTICDDSSVARTKQSGDYGAAGAIWSQGGTIYMNGTITNITGRAIYMDTGTVTVGGSITSITPDETNAWQGADGYIIHLRSTNSQATLTSTAVIDNNNITGTGSAISVLATCKLTAESGSVIKNVNKTVISITGDDSTLDFDGEITGKTGDGQAINAQNGNFYVKIGPNANIHDNTAWYGTIYIQGGGTMDVYGKINNNTSTDRGGAIAQANNISRTTINMYEGAEICNNTSAQTGGGVMVSNGVFNMYGGTISGNKAKSEGGGVYIRKAGQFNMSGGTISNNESESFGGGIAFDAGDWAADNINYFSPYANLTGGTITDNKDANGSNDLAISSTAFGHVNRYLSIGSGVTLGNNDVYTVHDTKYVTPVQADIKLGNASTDSITSLTNAASAKGWDKPYATFWMQRGGSATVAVTKNYNSQLPVYVLVQAVNESGTPADGALVTAYTTTVVKSGSKVSFTLPDANNGGSGYAVALVQPSADYGSVVITGPETLQQVKDKTSYDVSYTATYTMSPNLASMIKSYEAGINDQTCRFSFTVQLDSSLTAKTGEGEYTFTSPIFVIDRVEGSGSTLTAHVKLKSDWRYHINELTTTPMVLTGTGTGTFTDDDFESHKILNTTGTIQGTVDGGSVNLAIFIPANVCQTELVPLTKVTLSFDANGGTGKVDGKEIAEASMKDYLDESGEAVFTIPESSLTKDGYTFKGWSTDENGTTAEYSTGDKITVTEDTTLYAVWAADTPDPTPAVPVDWDVSKSKTATNLDENFESVVTLGLPSASYKGNLDVAFVLDGSTSADQSGLASAAAANLLDELAKMENLNVKASLTIFGGSNPYLEDTDLMVISGDSGASNLSTLMTKLTDPSYDKATGRSGSNLQAGVEAAKSKLAEDTSAASSDKYMIILSDGGARMWYENGASMSQTYNPNGNVYWNSNEDHLERYKNYGAVSARSFAEVWSDGHTKANIGKYGMTETQKNAASVTDTGVASWDTVRNGSDYYTTMEAAIYYAAQSITEAAQGSNIIYISYPYHPEDTFWASFDANFIGGFESFIGNGYATVYDSTSANASTIFSNVKDQLIQVVDRGSKVVDVIGKTDDYDFDFVDVQTLTVGGKELSKAAVTSGLDANETARYSFGDNAEFVLHYYENGTDGASEECFVWDINTAITKDNPVELSYKVKLTNPKTEAGTYGEYDEDGSQGKTALYTNNSAVLTPVDSNGNPGADETFPKPTVSYTVTAPETGSLTVSKTVAGDGADKTKEFSFTVTLGDKLSGTYGGMTFADGVATFKLKDGESVTAAGIPAGTTYAVTETVDASYTASYTVDGTAANSGVGSIEKDKTSTVAVTNTLVSSPAFTFTVTKLWNDSNNASGIRPSLVQVQLYKDKTTAVGQPVYLYANTGWTYKWTNLDAGSYSAAEVSVPSGYYVSSNTVSADGKSATIINSRYIVPFYGIKTGDDANLALWATLAGISLLGIAGAVIVIRRKRKNGAK